MKQIFITLSVIAFFSLAACTSQPGSNTTTTTDSIATEETTNTAKGQLFIIGGGKRPPSLVQDLINVSGLKDGGYAVVLPMSSTEPDTASFYGMKQFTDLGITDVTSFNFQKDAEPPQARLDSLQQATLIYITGGNQMLFMDVVAGTPIYDALHEAYQNGATIAGTSAGAAIMSKKMITGTEFKHPEYTGDFQTIEAENMEIVEGMGFLTNAIIDQHFIRRMRMNRLITVAIEHPNETCIGIDESTAILVKGNNATVYGESQVIVLKNPDNNKEVKNGLLGDKTLNLSVMLPGESFDL